MPGLSPFSSAWNCEAGGSSGKCLILSSLESYKFDIYLPNSRGYSKGSGSLM